MRRLVFGLLLLAAMFAVCDWTVAQPPPGLPSPRVQHAFPGGIKAGTTVEVTVTGFDVEDPEKILFAAPRTEGRIPPTTQRTAGPEGPQEDRSRAEDRSRRAAQVQNHRQRRRAAGTLRPPLRREVGRQQPSERSRSATRPK